MGHVVDEKGEKMSKSKGNIIRPREIIDQAGVDAVRLQFCTTDVGNSKRFSYELMKELVIPFLTVLYNSKKYYEQLDKKKNKKKVEDAWILSKLNTLIQEVTKDLENYDLSNPFLKIANFTIKDFSRGYIKMTRDRDDTKEIIGKVLEKISLLLAPFAPYISEHVYGIFSKKSVHLSPWPKVEKININKQLENDFDIVLKTIEKGLAERDRAQIGLKWPLAMASVTYFKVIDKKFWDIIKKELNVKELEVMTGSFKDEEDLFVELDTKMTPELEAEGYARNVIRSIQAFRKKLGLSPGENVKTVLIVDEKLKKMLEDHKKTVAEKTNSKELNVVTGSKETFKNKSDFKVKESKGEIAIIL
jgi:isoleucyl-tRNA synthetase